MRPPIFKNWAWIGISLTACLFLVACGKSGRRAAAPLSRLDWNRKTLVGAYENAGHTSPQWDEPAKAALDEYAVARSSRQGMDPEWSLIVSNNCVTTVRAGCDDPMIRLLYVRFCMSQQESKETFAKAFYKAATDIDSSQYPEIRKYYAWLRTGQQLNFAFGPKNIPPELTQQGSWGRTESYLMDALADKTMPPEEIYDACHEYLEEWRWSKDHYPSLYQNFEQKFPANWKKIPSLLLLKGEAYTQMAWLARGTGTSDSVTKDGWKLFGERLDIAADSLTRAWKLNTNDARIALQMMTVEMGQGQGRERMELWFHRAMNLNTNDYKACNFKLMYLEPKWYGSVPEMLAFGRECVRNSAWGGHVPLVMMDAHVAIQRQYVQDSAKTDYWRNPEVWQDLKEAFDRFFELNPAETGWYHNYAWFAYQAGQWNTFNTLLPKLGHVSYEYFGGQAEFEKMVALAKKGSAETKN